ncbi:MAG: ExbD/TolR family protein [Kiritimatiellia bacterium]
MAGETSKKRRKKKINFFGEEDQFEMPMSQMIDCVFLLLIFFMSVSTIDAVRTSKEVKLPLAADARAEKDESGRLVVDVEWSEGDFSIVIRLAGMTFREPQELIPHLTRFAEQHAQDGRILLRADERVPYMFTQELMAAVAEAGVGSVMFSTVEQEVPTSSGNAGGGA